MGLIILLQNVIKYLGSKIISFRTLFCNALNGLVHKRPPAARNRSESESSSISILPLLNQTNPHEIITIVEETDDDSEDNTVVIKSVNVVDDLKWIKHYNNRHKILLVGEGDFSFSACLALAFGRASNMIATSLDSKNFLKKNYKNARSNIRELSIRDCVVMHGIDATDMWNHDWLGEMRFDRIIYNFPYAGLFHKMSRESQLRHHRRLVSLFLKNAKEMLSENGEIHISHKTNGFHSEWKLVSIASSHRLRLIEEVEFNQDDYPGYNTKYGFGGDQNFNCNPSITYKFGLRTV
ncbi:hypothetical protein RD792_010718 [Penstemon davidsonii]|uniref:25S rRNA (uridine-N(3))-methyltransferase BMT5-like domain-containing protein n=1 Tax=Penstemon davidsonii TaxID=160366 RepID=A0ABR0D427_9LAMI|nr:hypothetical protein RD792_010718 [Penstemon davidsonii]